MPLLLGLVVLLIAAIAVGAYEAGGPGRAERAAVKRYVAAWSRQDWAAMYSQLSPSSRAAISEAAFAARYLSVAATATTTAMSFGPRITILKDTAQLPATIVTSTFGTLRETTSLDLDPADHSELDYHPTMLFPGLTAGESLRRTSELGARGTLEADDGAALAEGPGRTSPDPTVAAAIVGSLAPIPASEAAHYRSLGYPAGAMVGTTGLERIFQKRLAGTPGGTLLAGTRTLATAAPISGATVRTTIDPKLETATLDALGGGYDGMTVVNARTGAIEAAAGLAFSDLQPPGSTFKIITTAAALASGVATPATIYPMESQASLGGYIMQNAAGEVCGGSLVAAFASSCDTTFGPLGIQVGGPRLVTEAEKFGFNRPTGISGALKSTIPSAATIGDATAVGMTAIGQGRLEASTLEMADVGAAIANHGRRPVPTFVYGAKPRYVTATNATVAAEIQAMMQAVVSYGTGTTAQIPGYEVAGKTGTAELANTANQQNDVAETDAWFVGYVPHSRSGVVAAALYPANGYGADSAAPAVRAVLESALGIG